ncbi:Gfo/Idh/MocA family oxidoreductase [Emticicia agri]|uniref:Oxidoreductase n=1 Tax=Emticicia agri TaxID=2492393 RepID=A0A4Q5M233_9BACT|nr:Gfo/Idh/MocA family oxidoreductase [Emticicia agri]RYU96344.1 oxidoreductase [Emticicia agri]
MINVALVGFGLSGRYLQAPFFEANPNFRLKTIVCNSQDPRAIFPNVGVAKSIDEVLADDEIELVSICTPSLTHHELAIKSLQANKHILVEKPFTSIVAEAEEIVALAKEKNKVVCVFQNRRFDGDFRTVKKVVESGVLGELMSYEAHYDRYKPVLNSKRWKEVVSPANGILYDLGAHIIDQTITLFGAPKSVWGETYVQREGSEIDDAFDIRLDYGSLKVTLKSSLLVREEGPRYVIHGTKGSFVKYGLDVQEDNLKAGLMPGMEGFGVESKANSGILNAEINGVSFRGHVDTEVGNWGILFQNLYEVIAEGKEPLIKPEQIIAQMKVIEAVRQS